MPEPGDGNNRIDSVRVWWRINNNALRLVPKVDKGGCDGALNLELISAICPNFRGGIGMGLRTNCGAGAQILGMNELLISSRRCADFATTATENLQH
ncbi:hypothetical protein DYY88_00165 [Leptolyngbya iicbica LK]|uniref:Uncharacterized protein n=1 Tax=Leptolyngbya iicbica LK TaxID=2294035 RepID=A0A4V2E3A3_9CYAN|nr:hypothetical protein DYY88_00165 [Leptolyngbya sp. LK]